MGKELFIAEKPSVAREFAKTLGVNGNAGNGYLESNDYVVTWCVGHLVTMSYPEVYDPALKKWSLNTIPFMPDEFLYELIPDVRKQFNIVKGLLNRPDVERIYVCTDSGREGEYIYRLVDQQANVSKDKKKKRVWIDSQTEEEILRGIREAKPMAEYDNISSSAYLRAKEDYLMGINFSRALTLKYGPSVSNYMRSSDRTVISVGRVMTCVLGMIVNREREIRSFTKTPFYRVIGNFKLQEKPFTAEWRAVEGSKYYNSPALYKENGFKKKEDAERLIAELTAEPVGPVTVTGIEKKKENKNAPLLYNLAELQNDCSKYFKISPDETLRIVQELYEKKMTTYPRTDARVLSTAVAKEIHKNIGGLRSYALATPFAKEVLEQGTYKNIAKTRYVNDKQITDHYAIIPTGQGLNNLAGLAPTAAKVYEVIVRRFLSIFYPPAVYQKFSLTVKVKEENFFASFKVLVQEGYLKVANFSFKKENTAPKEDKENENESADEKCDAELTNLLMHLKKGDSLTADTYEIKEGETSPPKRYTSGSIILTMENAGQFIEDEELRAQIKGSGIGTSATRAEILKKLVNIEYLALNKKTQVLTPTQMGEMIYDVVSDSIRPLLNPALTASWEKGLTMVADGVITPEEYMGKLTDFVGRRTTAVRSLNNQGVLWRQFQATEEFYQKKTKQSNAKNKE